MGLEIVKEFIDKDRTGSNMRRADLLAMQTDGTAGLFRVLLVYHNDRLSRSVEDVRRIMRELNAVGVQVKFKNIDADLGTPEGLFNLNIMAAASEYFLGDLKRKTRDGMAQRKRSGTWTGRINCYFEIIDQAKGNVWDNIRPRPDRVLDILEMSRLRADGHSYRFIGAAHGIDNKKVKRVLMLWAWLNGQYAARGLEI
jgi:DNA invertase Pin-like site-specific DNA recombinase